MAQYWYSNQGRKTRHRLKDIPCKKKLLECSSDDAGFAKETRPDWRGGHVEHEQQPLVVANETKENAESSRPDNGCDIQVFANFPVSSLCCFVIRVVP